MATFLATLTLYILFNGCLSAQNVVLNGETSVIVSYSDRYNNTPFNLTFVEFETDFYNAFGLLALINDIGDIPYICSIDGVGQYNNLPVISVIYLGLFSSNPYPQTLLPNNGKDCYTGNQSHCVQVVYDTKKQMYALIAMSNDTLGAQFAIYTLSEKILGVDPLYRFSGINGEYFPNGIVLSSNLSYIYGPPLFDYRCMFNNDEDILGGWAADPLGLAVHSATVFGWYFESLLRMKGNCMIVGTVPYPDENSLKLAAKRGIAITDHHFNLMGVNTFRFPGSELENEWDWTSYPMTLEFVWRRSAEALANLGTEIIYSVGYRGTNDGQAPCPNCTTQELGMVISQVIANMTKWLPPNSKKITYAWGEGISLYKDGYLIVPPDVEFLLSDSGNGYINDLTEFANESAGFYTHVAYYGQGNQLTEMVPPQRQFDQIGTFSKTSKKNKYAIINTSDLRPYLLSCMAVFCYLYDPTKCGNNNAAQYIIDWVSFHYRFKQDTDSYWDEEFKETIAEQIADLYERYYNISYVYKGLSDMYIHDKMQQNQGEYINNLRANGTVTNETLQEMLNTLIQFDNATMKYIVDLYQDSQNLFAKISDNLTEESRSLFEVHILLQQSIHYYGTQIMYNNYYSAQAYNKLNYKLAFQLIQTNFDYWQQLFKNFRIYGERNQWKGFYLHSRIADYQALRASFRVLYVLVNNTKHCELPTRPYHYYMFTWYQLPYHDNYPVINFNKSSHLSSYIRIYCINTGSEINNINATNHCCMNNANGGTFHIDNNQCKNGAEIKFNVTDWNLCPTIRYTNDKTIPNQNSMSIVQTQNIINVKQSTYINARCQYQNKSLDDQITETFFQLN